MKFLRMRPASASSSSPRATSEVAEEDEALVEEFRRQLDQGMWAAVPTTVAPTAGAEAEMVRAFDDIPRDTDRVIFFPRAAGGAMAVGQLRSR